MNLVALLLPTLIVIVNGGCAPCLPSGQTCTECYIPGMTNIAPMSGMSEAITNAFPEKQKVSPEFIVRQDKNLYCSDPRGCSFSISIQYEGANYENEVGYFLLSQGKVVYEKVLFPRASISSDCLRQGATVSAGPFNPGDVVGFYLGQNFNCPSGKDTNLKIYSVADLNPNKKPLMSQMVFKGQVIIGFEDMPGGDDDYNDVMFSINMDNGMSLAAPSPPEYSLERLKALGCGPGSLNYDNFNPNYDPDVKAALAGKLWVNCGAYCVYDWNTPSAKVWVWDPVKKNYNPVTDRKNDCFQKYNAELQAAVQKQVLEWTNVDCSLGEWSDWSSCTQSCNGGSKQRMRYIRVPASGTGQPCPTSKEVASCNTNWCPIDCSVSEWAAWGKCDKTCGGGSQYRRRGVTVSPQNGGTPCPTLEDSSQCNTNLCPIDCVVGDWSSWTTCDKSCGRGSQIRTRTINVPNRYGGVNCPSLQQIQECNTQECPIDCVQSNWENWSQCDKSCGSGSSSRSRSIVVAPQYGGRECANSIEVTSCNTQPCPVDCVVSGWSEWGLCDKSCGGGYQARDRAVALTASNGGAGCPSTYEVQSCNTQPCAVDCEVSEWSELSQCDKTCGGGQQYRTRAIIKSAEFGGRECATTREVQPCNELQCPVDCVVSDWNAWSTCDKTCGGGSKTRSRNIIKPDHFGGSPCPSLTDMALCNVQECPVDCVLSGWDDWSQCDKTCGVGEQSRKRRIVVQPQFGGIACGALEEKTECSTNPCPIDCVVNQWSEWNTCTKTCGSGTRERRREITVNANYGGAVCPELVQTESCNTIECPIDCEVSEWNNWGDCDRTCGGGSQTRLRTITTSQKFGGLSCPELQQTQQCNVNPCPIDCVLTEWEAWSNCDRSCGGGSQTRQRRVQTPPQFDGKACGLIKDISSCNTQPCPIDCIVSDWSEWSTCDRTCGGGRQTRSRVVTTSNNYGGIKCPSLVDSQVCNTDLCAIDCEVGDWSEWSQCDQTCGGGSQSRSRTITKSPQFGGKDCASTSEIQPCATTPCPVDCEVTEWSSWSVCDRPCGNGAQTRTRLVETPARYGGSKCPVLSKSRSCNTQECPVDCKVSAWSDWSACSVSCGGGSQARQRTIITAPRSGGASCPSTTETVSCNIRPCPIDCVLSAWSEWSTCNKQCGSGESKRTRSIVTDSNYGGVLCGQTIETVVCNTNPCDVNCVTSDWSAWSSCSVKCGGGVIKRQRSIVVQPKGNGNPCGDLEQSSPCNTVGCPVDCSMTDWTAWSSCDRPCAGGSQIRTRTVTTPSANGGVACGATQESASCNPQSCPTSRACTYIEQDKQGTVSCPSGFVILSVDFASYGRPSGDCPSYSASTGFLGCHADTSLEVIKGLCVGKQSCSITPTNDMFGGNPCIILNKWLDVAVTCGYQFMFGNGPLATIPPSFVVPVFSSPAIGCDCNTMIAVDTSLSSVFWNIGPLRQYVQNLATGLVTSSATAQVGIVSFAWTINLDSPFTRDSNKLATAAQSISRNWGASSNLAGALLTVGSEFNKVSGCKRLILYTDGTAGSKDVVESRIATLKSSGVKVQVVAVDGWYNNVDEMKKIASSPGDYVSIDKFSALPLLGLKLAIQCQLSGRLKDGSKLDAVIQHSSFNSAIVLIAAVFVVGVILVMVVKRRRRFIQLPNDLLIELAL